MRNLWIIAAIAVAGIGISGCTPNCDEWYEADGSDCVEVRTKYFGYYVGTAVTGGQSSNAYVDISTYNGNVQRLSCESDGTWYIEMTGDNSFSIPLQNVYAQAGTIQVEGSGSFNGSQVIMNYAVTYQGQTAVVNFTGTK